MLHWEAFLFLLMQLSAIYKCSLCSSRTLASHVAACHFELQKQSNSEGTKKIICSLPSHPVCTRNQVCFIQTAYTAMLSKNFNLNSQSFRRKKYDRVVKPIFRGLEYQIKKYHLDAISNGYCQTKEDVECVFVRIVWKSIFIYSKTKCFSAAFHLLPFLFISPVKLHRTSVQQNAKYILID